MNNTHFKHAFTLAETLITISIIGIVAAMTLSTIINKSQQFILKNQFKKAYNTILNAMLMAQAKMGYPINCYYWDTNPYGDWVCTKEDQYGGCIKMSLSDGSPLPNDYNGQTRDCKTLDNIVFNEILTTILDCPDKALERGCLTNKYRGLDKIKVEDGTAEDKVNPNQMFSDSNIKQKYPVWVLNNGIVVIRYHSKGSLPIYIIDVNGHRGPNKWGYDMFGFRIKGNSKYGILKLAPDTSYPAEKGGKSNTQMYIEAFTK